MTNRERGSGNCVRDEEHVPQGQCPRGELLRGRRRRRLEVHGYSTLATKQSTESQHGKPQVHQNIHQTPFAARSRRIHGVLDRSRVDCPCWSGGDHLARAISRSLGQAEQIRIRRKHSFTRHTQDSSMVTGGHWGGSSLSLLLRRCVARRRRHKHKNTNNNDTRGILPRRHKRVFVLRPRTTNHLFALLFYAPVHSIISVDVISSIDSSPFAHNPHCVYPRLDHSLNANSAPGSPLGFIRFDSLLLSLHHFSLFSLARHCGGRTHGDI